MPTYKKYAIRIVNNWSLITNYERTHICSIYGYNSDTQERYFTTWDLPDGWAILEPNNKDNKYINVFSKEESENTQNIPGYIEKQNTTEKLNDISIDMDHYKLLSYVQGVIIMGMGWLIKTYIDNDMRCMDTVGERYV